MDSLLNSITIESSLEQCQRYVQTTCLTRLKQAGIVTLGDLLPLSVAELEQAGVDYYDALILRGLIGSGVRRDQERSESYLATPSFRES